MLSIRTSLRASSSKLPHTKFLSRSASFQARQFVPNPNGPNVQIVRWLMKALESDGILSLENGSFRARKFQQAFQAIDACPDAIKSGRDALAIVGVGEGIARRIDEFLHPQILDYTKRTSPDKPTKSIFDLERDECIAEFKRVPGIGPMKAGKLFEAGCRTLGDLKHPRHAKMLSAPVRKALDYVDHLEARVTRAEVDAVLGEMRQRLSSDVRLHAVGSYRRGLATSGDIDLIVFHPSYSYVPQPSEKLHSASSPLSLSSSSSRARRRTGKEAITSSQNAQSTTLRREILAPLERAGLISETLSESPNRWQGIVRVLFSCGTEAEAVFRKMDISIYPTLSEGSALLASTGDVDFNAHIRACATKQGLVLNDYGLWRFIPASSSDSPSTLASTSDSPTLSFSVHAKQGLSTEDGHWELIASADETEILESLGVGYVVPEKRNFSFIVQRSKSEASALLKAHMPPMPRVKRARGRSNGGKAF